MASRIREYRHAREAHEAAIASLINEARTFNNDSAPFRIRDLLSAGRNYGRTLARLETMRGKK